MTFVPLDSLRIQRISVPLVTSVVPSVQTLKIVHPVKQDSTLSMDSVLLNAQLLSFHMKELVSLAHADVLVVLVQMFVILAKMDI